MNKCKYWNDHMNTIIALIGCLYDIEGCSCGGLLHVMVDDDNLDDSTIAWTLAECLKNPSKEESGIGKLICEEYVKLSMEERRLVNNHCDYITDDGYCYLNCQGCEKCYVETGELEDK